jgi:hypothetical protein
VQTDPHRALTLQVVNKDAQVYGSYDSCSCAPDSTTNAAGGQSYATYQPCDPNADTGSSTIPDCTTTFQNTVSASLNAPNDGIITVELSDDTGVLEQFSFEVATPKSIDVKATAGAAATAITPDASGVYQLHLADQSVELTTHLLTADGRVLVAGGNQASLSATISDSRVLARDPMAKGLGIKLTGAGDATVTLTNGAKLTSVVKFHVSS